MVPELPRTSAATLPKRTWLGRGKRLPVIVTPVPPAVPPLDVLKLETDGAEAAVKLNRELEDGAEIPLGPCTRTSMVPAAAGGEVTVMDVFELTMKSLTNVSPK